MKRNEITEEMVKLVGAGIREYNSNAPPVGIISFRDGKQVPTTPEDKVMYDRQWSEAVRHGLYSMCTDGEV